MIIKVNPVQSCAGLKNTKEYRFSSKSEENAKSSKFCRFSQCLKCKRVSKCKMTSDECEDTSGKCIYFEE